MIGQIADPGLRDQMGFSLHDTHVSVAEQWLRAAEQTRRVRWSAPTRLLAILVQATLDGVLVDFLARGDGAGVREVLDIFADQLAGSAQSI